MPIPVARTASGTAQSADADADGDADGDAGVLAAMLPRLRDLGTCLARARELPAFLEDAASASDCQEGLDCLEVLADVAGPSASAAQWLRRAAAGER